jgi:inosine-uridine nucleoside N-ribohydrolase
MKYNLRQDENESMRVIIDCDPGNGVPGANIDDGLALALAIAAPQITLEMITTVAGNTPVETGYAVAKALVRQLDIPVPVYRGAALARKTRSWRRSRWLTSAMVGRPCAANVSGRAAFGTAGHR